MTETTAPSIAVVIVNFNGGQLVENCLQALLEQTEPASRVIVIDNASTDGSAERLASISEKPEKKFLMVRLDENRGFAGANNHAFTLIKDCDWVALLNPDTRVSADWIAQLRHGVRENPGCTFFSCRLVSLQNPQILDGTGDCYHVSGLGWRRDHGADASRRREPGETIFGPCGAAAMYRLDAIRAVGGFDENYFCYNEDTDLAFRLRLIGGRCCHLDSCSVAHVGSAISGFQSDFTVYHGHRNLVWTYLKNMPSALLWRYLPQHLLLNLVSLVYYTFKGRPGVIFKAKWHALLGLHRVFKQRKKIQSMKQVASSELQEAMVTRPLAAYFNRHGR